LHSSVGAAPVENPMARSRPRLDAGLLAAALLALFVMQPLWQPGLPSTADTPIHYYRTLEFANSYAPGIVYPRWAPHLAYGYGLPTWSFVPPLPYLLPLPLWSLGLSLEGSLKATVMLIALGYALGAYLFVRAHVGAPGGLVAAAVYTLAPFALREVLLYGGNYPQYLAIGLFPWVLWAVGRLIRRPGWPNVALTALLFGAVVLSHLFHALVLAPVVVLYALLLWLTGGRGQRRLAAAVAGLGLGLLWTAFFWVPALFERDWTRAVESRYLDVSPITLRFLDARELLALPQPLDRACANPWVPFALGPVILLLVALGLVAFCRCVAVEFRKARQASSGGRSLTVAARDTAVLWVPGLFFLLLAALCVFMMLPQSSWLWLHVPLLAVAEFPWRLLGLVNLSLAFLSGAACVLVTSPPPRNSAGLRAPLFPQTMQGCAARQRGDNPIPIPTSIPISITLSILALLAVLLGSAVYLYPVRPFERHGETLADLAGYELATHTIGLTTLGEYVPRWVEQVPRSSALAEALARGEPPAEIEKLDRTRLPDGASARRVEHSAVSDGYRVETAQPFQARFLTFYFPGWQAALDGQPAPIAVEPETGFVTVAVPAGAHEVRVWFGDTPLRRAADIVSGVAFAALALMSLWCGLRGAIARGFTRKKTGGPPYVRVDPGSSVSHHQSRERGWGEVLPAAVLLVVFLLKVLLVDPHTDWFRRHSPPGQVIGVQHALQVDLDGRFWLLGYDVEGTQVAQGDSLQVVLYWQAQQRTSTNYRPFVHLDSPADERTWAISDNFHPGDATAQIELPTGTWDTTHYVRDEHRLVVPPDVPPVTFNLRAGLYDPETGARVPLGDGGDTIMLQPVQVTPGRGLTLDTLPNPADYRLGETIHLRGTAWDEAGSTLRLYWQAERPTTEDVVVFVHLLDQAGNLAWGADSPPLGGLYPATAWQPGEVVADPRTVQISGLALGEYTLAVGLYHPATLARLPVVDAAGRPVPDDVIRLMKVEVHDNQE
jgi:hypothetical protein